MRAHRVVIVGYGMAGARLAEELRTRDPHGERIAVTVVGAEPELAYNRVLLSSVLAGTMRPDAVVLHDEEWAERTRVDLRIGVTATEIDRDRRALRLGDGTELAYDSLVLATGAAPWLPPVEDLELGDGVIAFRTLDDCARITEAASGDAEVAVLGGGLLGLEAARGLAGKGNTVTVVHPFGHVMERQLDDGGGRALAAALRGLGVEFRLDVFATKYLPGDGLKLADGSHVQADLVVVSAGVRPETGLAERAGITVDGGIVVDDALRTDDPAIHAIGDCARHPGTVAGMVQSAWEQAEALADVLTGGGTRYLGTEAITRLKARDVDVTALGETQTDIDEAEVLRFDDPARARYAKLVLRDDRVAGAVLVGFPDAAAQITQLYDRRLPVPSDRLAVLLGRALPATAASPADLPASAVICRCNSVTKGRLVDAWRGGATDVTALRSATRASTGCGSCADAVCDLAKWLGSQ